MDLDNEQASYALAEAAMKAHTQAIRYREVLRQVRAIAQGIPLTGDDDEARLQTIVYMIDNALTEDA